MRAVRMWTVVAALLITLIFVAVSGAQAKTDWELISAIARLYEQNPSIGNDKRLLDAMSKVETAFGEARDILPAAREALALAKKIKGKESLAAGLAYVAIAIAEERRQAPQAAIESYEQAETISRRIDRAERFDSETRLEISRRILELRLTQFERPGKGGTQPGPAQKAALLETLYDVVARIDLVDSSDRVAAEGPIQRAITMLSKDVKRAPAEPMLPFGFPFWVPAYAAFDNRPVRNFEASWTYLDLISRIAILQKSYPPKNPKFLSVVRNQLVNAIETNILIDNEQLEIRKEVEPIFRRALALVQELEGKNHRALMAGRMALARAFVKDRRHDEAERALKQLLAEAEENSVSDKYIQGGIVYALMINEIERGNMFAATQYANTGLIVEETFGATFPEKIDWLFVVAAAFGERGHFAESASFYQRAVDAVGNGKAPFAYGHYLLAYAEVEKRLGLPEKTEPLLEEALMRFRAQGRGGIRGVVQALKSLAQLQQETGRLDEALVSIREATHLEGEIIAGRVPDNRTEEAQFAGRWKSSGVFATHLRLLDEARAQWPAKEEILVSEGFEIAQLMAASEAATALTKMSERLAAGQDEVALLLRNRQDAIQWLERSSAKYRREREKSEVGAFSQARTKTEQDLFEDMVKADQQISAINNQLEQFPRFREIQIGTSVPATEIQKLLGPREAMLAYRILDDRTYAFVVRREGVRMRALSFGQADVSRLVDAIRRTLDVSNHGAPPPFAITEMAELSRHILTPMTNDIKGADHIIFVPDGAMQSLPPAVLFAEEPHRPVASSAPPYQDLPFLVQRFATSVLPAAASLKSLREHPPLVPAPLPFFGIGDPALEGREVDREATATAHFIKQSLQKCAPAKLLSRVEGADGELRTLATLVGAGEESLLLGSKATKAALRLIPLEQYRIVAFATHALVPNTILGVSEPALALSPLKSLGECDENVLTSSDVATMRLNADWVILSACNTGAAPNQETDAEQLSGLAEAFFYAGSRSLLVSHWRVRSDMAAKLTTQTLQVLTEHPEIGRAAALQQATLAVINSGTYPHPANWAPFVVIGEGGAGR